MNTNQTKKKLPINELIEGSFNIIQYANAFNEYIGWSLYTGYASKGWANQEDAKDYVYYASKGLCYIGSWTGINANSSANEIKKDIDARIDVLMAAFEKAMQKFDNENPLLEKAHPTGRDALEALSSKYFMVPEFFFRCKEGPYPLVRIKRDKDTGNNSEEGNQGYLPVEYIKREIEEKFKAIVDAHYEKYNTFHTYHLVIGSVMTSNIKNYEAFFDERVEKRAEEFQEAYKDKSLAATVKTYFDNPNLRRFNPKTVRDDYKTFFDELLADTRKKPLCTVRNRGLVFFGHPATGSYAEYKYEKQKQSSIDLPLGMLESDKLVHGNMITEWMAVHPSYSIAGGDKLGHPDQAFARFCPFGTSINFDGLIKDMFLKPYDLDQHIYDLIKQVFIARNRNFDTGIELCLDHMEKRLRRTVGMTIEAGADDDNYPLTIQIVPSAGAKLDSEGLAIEQGGAAFNIDGLSPILSTEIHQLIADAKDNELDEEDDDDYDDNPEKKYASFYIENGESKTGVISNVYSKYMSSEWRNPNPNALDKYYYSHTQLAFALPDSYMAGYVNALGNNNEKARTYRTNLKGERYNHLLDHFDSKNILLKDIEYNQGLFVAGIGELHHYYPNKGNYPIKRSFGRFGNFEDTDIKTTPTEREGKIIELIVFYQRNKDNEKYFTGLKIKYSLGHTQKIGHCNTANDGYESIKLGRNEFIDAVYACYTTRKWNYDTSSVIEYIEFRTAAIFKKNNQKIRRVKWSEIFVNRKNRKNTIDEYHVCREIEGIKPLTRIVGYEDNPQDLSKNKSLMQLDFYFGKTTYNTLPIVKSLVDTTTAPTFIPTPKEPITKIKLYFDKNKQTYTGIQVYYGGFEGSVFGKETKTYETLTLSEQERLVGIAALVVFNKNAGGRCNFQEFLFRIKNLNETVTIKDRTFPKRRSKMFNAVISCTGNNEDLKKLERVSFSTKSIDRYKANAIRRLKSNKPNMENYSFRYIYHKDLPIWKIIPHITYNFSEYYTETLDGLTVKLGNPFYL